MTMQPLEREQQRLREIAREYRQRGYEVLLSPRADQLPDFLAPFQIDMLARNAAENVVVEVRTQESLAATLELDAVAVALHEKSNWRFELVVTNPKDPSTLAIKGATALDQTDFTYRLHEARQLSAQEHGEAAFLLAWSALEALLRTIARSEGIATEQQDSAQLTKSMFAYGIIDKEQYQTLQDSLHARNVLIHGYKDDRPFARTFEQLLKVIEQLQSAQPTT